MAKVKKDPAAKTAASSPPFALVDKNGVDLAVGDEVLIDCPGSLHNSKAGTITQFFGHDTPQGPRANVSFGNGEAAPVFCAFLVYVSTPQRALDVKGAELQQGDTVSGVLGTSWATRRGTVLSLDFLPGTTPGVIVDFPATETEPADKLMLPCDCLVKVAAPAPPPAEPETDLPFLDDNAQRAGLRVLPLASIHVVRNTRKVFDEAALAELAQSIKAHGVLQPIVVRPAPGAADTDYELAAGERRLRASKLAGLTEIPAVVRQMDAREMLEIQLLENLQRVDVRPADEAQAFAELLRNGFSAEEVALKVGKPTKFVLQRAKLVALLPFWMDALLADKLDLAAAHELARLPAHSQLVVKQEAEAQPYNFQKRYGKRDIRDLIEEKVLHNLGKAGWDKADATLVPSAGPCTLCPKRSGAQGLLFETKNDKDLCLDAGCFASKKAAHVARRLAEVTAEMGKEPLRVSTNFYLDKESKATGVVGYSDFNWSEEGKDGAMPALVVDGPDAGQVKYVRPAIRTMNTTALDNPEMEAQRKQEEASRIRKQRLDKMLRVITAEKLTFDLEMLPTGYAAEATLRFLIEDDLRGKSSSKLAYLVSGFGWPEMAEGQLDNWKQREENGEYPYTNYLRANMEPLGFEQLLRLFLTLQVRHKMDYEWENRQEKIAQHVGFRYDGLQQQAEDAVEARYYTKKGKKQEATA